MGWITRLAVLCMLALGAAAQGSGHGKLFVVWPERDTATPKRWTIFIHAVHLEDGYAGIRHILGIADAASQVRELRKEITSLPGLGLNWVTGRKLFLADPVRTIPVQLQKMTALAEGYRTGISIEVEAIESNLPIPPKANSFGEAPPFLLTEGPLSSLKSFSSAPSPDVATLAQLRKVALAVRFGTRSPASFDGKVKPEVDSDAVLDAKYKLQNEWILSFRQNKQAWTILPFEILVRSGEPQEKASVVYRQTSGGWEVAGRFPGRATDVLPDIDGDGLAEIGGYGPDRTYVVWSAREGTGELYSQSATE